jgi:hypothetical protein
LPAKTQSQRIFTSRDLVPDQRIPRQSLSAARDGKDAAYAKEYDEKYAERLKTDLY